MAAKPFDDLDALGNRGAEVPGAFHQVTLVEVVRAHTNAHQLLHQLALNVHTVVHASQQHGLVAQRDARTGELVGGFFQFLGDLVGMIDMDIQPQRMDTFAAYRSVQWSRAWA